MMGWLNVMDHVPSETLDGQSFGEWVSANTGLFVGIVFGIIFAVIAIIALVTYRRRNQGNPSPSQSPASAGEGGRFCSSCGRKLGGSSNFCDGCGNKVK